MRMVVEFCSGTFTLTYTLVVGLDLLGGSRGSIWS